jgi:CelD/BcsL family acetyltransferase involved in cellulose biosynthesis
LIQSISLPRRGFALPSVRDSLSAFTVRTEIGGIELIDRLAGEWRALAAGDPRTLPMMMPEWIATHLRRHEPGAQLIIVTARRDGRLSALLPLVSESIRYHGVPLTRWRFANDYRYPAPTDLLHAEQDRDRAVQAIWRHLAADTRWDLLELADVAEGTARSNLLNLANAMGSRRSGGAIA